MSNYKNALEIINEIQLNIFLTDIFQNILNFLGIIKNEFFNHKMK